MHIPDSPKQNNIPLAILLIKSKFKESMAMKKTIIIATLLSFMSFNAFSAHTNKNLHPHGRINLTVNVLEKSLDGKVINSYSNDVVMREDEFIQLYSNNGDKKAVTAYDENNHKEVFLVLRSIKEKGGFVGGVRYDINQVTGYAKHGSAKSGFTPINHSHMGEKYFALKDDLVINIPFSVDEKIGASPALEVRIHINS